MIVVFIIFYYLFVKSINRLFSLNRVNQSLTKVNQAIVRQALIYISQPKTLLPKLCYHLRQIQLILISSRTILTSSFCFKDFEGLKIII